MPSTPDAPASAPSEIRFFPDVNLRSESERGRCGKFATPPLDLDSLDLEVPPELMGRPLVPIQIDAHRRENLSYRSPSPTPVLTTIRLYGRLGRKFGRVHHLAVETPAEAMNALDTLFPGFRREIKSMSPRYEFLVKIGERATSAQGMYLKHSGREMSITPILEGRAGNKGIGEIILGVALIVVGVVVAALASWTGIGAVIGVDIALMGVGLIIGGISALIAGTPTTNSNKARASYNFGGSVNVVEQGAPAALPYGKVFCGSVVGSSSILARDVAIGSDKTPGANAQNADFSTGGIFTELLGDGSTISANGQGVNNTGTGTGTSTGTGQGATGGGSVGGGGGIHGGPVLAYHHPERTREQWREAIGAGGGGGSSSSAKEDPDSLESREYAQIMDLIGEGPIRGLVDGQKSIFLNDTPIQNPDGTFNFKNYEIHFVSGTQDQDYIPNFDSEEATDGVNFALKHQFPYIKLLENPNLDAIRVNVVAGRMTEQNTKNGDLHGSSVSLTIELSCGGGSYVQVIADTIKGKTESNYTRSYLVKIPDSGRPGPYQLRVTRLTEDSKKATISNEIAVESVTQIVYVKLKHPNTVKCGLSFDAEQFPNIPTRTYYIYGLMIRIPANYDPDTKVYATQGTGTSNGEWDGTFKTAWTCNPAWVLWDILTQKRYGMGQFLKASDLDKWAFYAAAKYCDALVPNGLKNDDGSDIMESRYEFHAYIAGRKEALQVVSDIAGIMRAAAAYIGGNIVPVMDRFVDPSEYVQPFGPSNVIDGNFTFSNSSRNARHNVALVTWNDPADMGKPKTEYVENAAEIAQYGIREMNVSPIGCYSRGQAHRTGRWALLTEDARTEVCNFSTGFDGAGLLPGDVVPLSVPSRAGRVVTGRLNSATNNTVTLDREVTLTNGNSYSLMFTATDGSFRTAEIASGAGTHTTLNFTTNQAHPPSKDTTWILSSTDLEPELFRVLTVSRKDNLKSDVSTIAYNPSLYDAIDRGYTLESYPTSVLPSATSCKPPSALVIAERAVVEGTGVQRVLQVTFTPSLDPYLRDYGLQYRINGGNWIKVNNSPVPLFDVPVHSTGQYDFQLNAFNALGAPSLPLLGTYSVNDDNPLAAFEITGLELFGNANGNVFGGRDINLTWRINSAATTANEFGAERYGSGAGGVDPMFSDFEIRFIRLSDGVTVFTQQLTETQYTLSYDRNSQMIAPGDSKPLGPYRSLRVQVVGHDKYGNETLPAEITPSNPRPDKIIASRIVVNKYFNGVTFLIPNDGDLDFAGVKIYASTSQADVVGDGSAGFVPNGEFLVYDGSSTTAFVLQPPGIQGVQTPYYYRFGAYDAFNPNEFVLSDPIQVVNDFLNSNDLAGSIRTLLGIIPVTAAGLATEVTNRVDGDSALYSQFQIVYALAGANAAAITTIQTAYADFSQAYAQFSQLIQTQVGQNTADILTEATARSNADGALASQITVVKASSDANSAAITSEQTARASGDSANATAIQAVTATVGGLAASVTQQSQALADINGHLSASYALTLDVNGYISGMTLLNGGSGRSSVIFTTDVFKIVNPGAGSDTIAPFDVENGSIIIGVPMQSYNYVPGVSGWLLSPDGYSEFTNPKNNAPPANEPTPNITLQAPTGLGSLGPLSTNQGARFKLNCPSSAHSGNYNVWICYTDDGSSPYDSGYVVQKGTYTQTYYPNVPGDSLIIRACAVFADQYGNINPALGTSPIATGYISWKNQPLP